jgi:hypothetical protein
MSAVTAEGTADLMKAMESALSSQMEYISCTISYEDVTLLSTVHNLGILDEVQYQDEGVFVRGKVPLFLKEQIDNRGQYDSDGETDEEDEEDGNGDYKKKSTTTEVDDQFDWSGLAKGRHSARREWEETEGDGNSGYHTDIDDDDMMEGKVGERGGFAYLGNPIGVSGENIVGGKRTKSVVKRGKREGFEIMPRK